MAVQALPRSGASIAQQATSLPPLVLAVALVPSTVDMLKAVQPGLALGGLSELACVVAFLVLLATWLRFPRTSWLLAASFAADVSLAMRLVGGLDAAPVLSLLSVVALGIGGAFESHEPGSLSPERV